MRFSLWDALTLGTELASSPTNTVPVTNGVFTVQLDFGTSHFQGQDRWLQIDVWPNGSPQEVVLAPRTRLAPTPNAIYAAKAGSVTNGAITVSQLRTAGAPSQDQILAYDGISLVWRTPGAGDGIWTQVGSIAHYNLGNVGIGTANPQKLLQVGDSSVPNSQGMIRLSSRSGVGAHLRNWDVGVPGGDNPNGANYSFVIDDTHLGTIPELMVKWGSGNVGIGVVDPLRKLEVAGSGHFQSQLSTAGDLVMHGAETENALGILQIFGNSPPQVFPNPTRFIVRKDGNVGIGTPTPAAKLDVQSAPGIAVLARGGIEGVRGESTHANAAGVAGFNINTGSAANGAGVYGESLGGRGAGVWGKSTRFEGVHGESSAADFAATVGVNLGNGGGVYGESRGSGPGVWGVSASGEGVHGESRVNNFAAVAGVNVAAGTGVYGVSLGGGYAGVFDGKLRVFCLEIAGGCDLAEPFPMKEQHIEKGSVVVIDDQNPGHLKRSTRAYDKRVAGIVSGANGINPGIALKQEGVMDQGENVALTGRVYVKADASFGAIEAGDLLTTSDNPGHAMKVSDSVRAQGAILGKAMGALREGTGLVLVLVTLQ